MEFQFGCGCQTSHAGLLQFIVLLRMLVSNSIFPLLIYIFFTHTLSNSHNDTLWRTKTYLQGIFL